MAKLSVKPLITSFDIVEHIYEFQDICTAQAELIANDFAAESPIETGARIHAFLKCMKYVKDAGTQTVKTPYAFLRTGYGDCKTFSVFAYSILDALDLNPEYVLVNATDEDQPDHIYVRFEFAGDFIYLDGTINGYPLEPIYTRKWIWHKEQ